MREVGIMAARKQAAGFKAGDRAELVDADRSRGPDLTPYLGTVVTVRSARPDASGECQMLDVAGDLGDSNGPLWSWRFRPVEEDPNTAAPDPINSPAHYVTPGYAFEVIDAIEAWGLNYRLGAVVKYVARHARKGEPLKDLRKARWYLDREIAKMEADTSNPTKAAKP